MCRDDRHRESLLCSAEREAIAAIRAVADDQEVALPHALRRAVMFLFEHRAYERRNFGERFATRPVGVATICAEVRLDTFAVCAALLYEAVHDAAASIDEVRARFGDQVAEIVAGAIRLIGYAYRSSTEANAEMYRRMIVTTASDFRVLTVCFADQLHRLRTVGELPRREQISQAKEALEVYAVLADRLGIDAIKWELEDLAFATLHPRKYQEINGLVNQEREQRERYVAKAGGYLTKELDALGIRAEISGRAKHFYSIYLKMTREGLAFNEISDLMAMRVIVESVRDCYGAIAVTHSLWRPLPGQFKDMIAMPKFNMYQALHTTVIGPEGRPLEIQIRTADMHATAEYGVAAHWRYREGTRGMGAIDPTDAKLTWLRSLLHWEADVEDPRAFAELVEEEVFVFTPKGEVKSLAKGATPIDFAYVIHTDIGHGCTGAKVNGEVVPLHYELQLGDTVEVLTGEQERGPSHDWLAVVKTARARRKIKAWLKPRRVEGTGRAVGSARVRPRLRLARCCAPGAGDPIAAYVSPRRGIAIHREDCRRAAGADLGRLLEARWDRDGNAQVRFEIELVLATPDDLAAVRSSLITAGATVPQAVELADESPQTHARVVLEGRDDRQVRATIRRLRRHARVVDARLVGSG